MPNKGKRVIFPMHLLVMASFFDDAEQQRVKSKLNDIALLDLGHKLKASLTKHFKLTCDFNLGLVPRFLRADSIALAPNTYASRVAEQMGQETEQPVFLLSEASCEAISGPAEIRPSDLDSFPAVTFLTLPFVLCFTVEDFKSSGLADDKAAYHDWRPDITALVGERCDLTPIGVTAYHKLFVALDFINKNMLMDKVAAQVKQKATMFMSMDGAELLISKGSLYLPFFTFDEYAEAKPDLPEKELGVAYLRWLDRLRLLMYGLDKRNLKFKTISNLADFRTLDLATMEKITQTATPLPEVIETSVLDTGWDRVQDLVLDIYQDDSRFVCSVLSGFDEGGGLVYQTNFHISRPSGLQGMQDRVRELVNSCGIEAVVKISPLHYRNRKLISPETCRGGASMSVSAAPPATLAAMPASITLH